MRNAGSELDTLVAEKIFGITLVDTFTGERRQITAMEVMARENARNTIPLYSTDIGAAWTVLEQLLRKGAMAQVHFTMGTWMATWRMYNDPPSPTIKATAATAPHAICLLALKAVGN